MIKTYGTPMRGTWMLQVNTEEWFIGLAARRYQFGGEGGQVFVALPCLRLIYTF